MSNRDSSFLHASIDAKLAGLLDALPARPSWYERWRHLRPDSSEEERLAVYQAIRDSGVLPEDAGLYLVSWQVDAFASQHAELALHHLDERLRAIEAAHGLEEDDFWEPGEAPAEYEAVLRQYERAWDEIFAVQLDGFGEQAIAALFRTDRAE
jgi:hypothetical protein